MNTAAGRQLLTGLGLNICSDDEHNFVYLGEFITNMPGSASKRFYYKCNICGISRSEHIPIHIEE